MIILIILEEIFIFETAACWKRRTENDSESFRFRLLSNRRQFIHPFMLQIIDSPTTMMMMSFFPFSEQQTSLARSQKNTSPKQSYRKQSNIAVNRVNWGRKSFVGGKKQSTEEIKSEVVVDTQHQLILQYTFMLLFSIWASTFPRLYS